MKINFKPSTARHIADRQKSGPPKVEDGHLGLNGKIALALTKAVGSMWCAYAFAGLALLVLPDAIKGGMLTLIQWVSQTFIQLVMLSVIMVGQNILGKASDARSELTYKDADATFHEAEQIQLHLKDQDEAINHILDRLEKMEAALEKAIKTNGA